jgi:hypothetical protein
MSQSDQTESTIEDKKENSEASSSLSQAMLLQALKIFQESKMLGKDEKKGSALTDGIIEL